MDKGRRMFVMISYIDHVCAHNVVLKLYLLCVCVCVLVQRKKCACLTVWLNRILCINKSGQLYPCAGCVHACRVGVIDGHSL